MLINLRTPLWIRNGFFAQIWHTTCLNQSQGSVKKPQALAVERPVELFESNLGSAQCAEEEDR